MITQETKFDAPEAMRIDATMFGVTGIQPF